MIGSRLIGAAPLAAGRRRPPKITPISVPTGFRWSGPDDGLTPAYTGVSSAKLQERIDAIRRRK